MENSTQNYYKKFLLIAVGFTVFKIIGVYFSQLPLWADEAQYWVWSRNLDFGYYSKPPLIAWVIALFTKLFGNSEFALRLPASLIHFATAIIVFKIALKLFNSKTAIYAGLTFLFSSGVSFSSHFFSTDALLILFWALAMFFSVKALAKNKLKHWLLVGVSVGLGMLSKYTILLFYPSLFLFLICSKEHRSKLLQIGFWASGIIAVLVFMPNILWNLQNNSVSLHHTQDNVFTGGIALYPKDLLEFFGAQFIVFGIISFGLYSVFLVKNIRKIFSLEAPQKLLLFLSLPILFAGLTIALISGAQAHWIAPLYIFASIQIAHYFNNNSWLKTSNLVNLIISIVFFIFCMNANIIQNNFHIKFLNRLNNWSNLDTPIKQALADKQNTIVLVDERKSAATMLYYLKDENGNLPQIFKWNENKATEDYFDMKFDMASQIGKNAIFVTRADDSSVKNFFSKSVQIKNDNLPEKFSMYYLEGFKGY